MECQHCGRETPEGNYCVWCGARLQAGEGARRRSQAYAASPNEHVLAPSPISTFFPHLNTHRTQQTGGLLLLLVVGLVALGFARLLPISTVLAALIVPLIYLVYFYEVEIYEDEPIAVILGTFVAGGVLGAVFSVLTYRSTLSLITPGRAPGTNYYLVVGVLWPLIIQALMLVGPLALFFLRRKPSHDMLDGMTFGVASGLGFAAAQSIANSWVLITGAPQLAGNTDPWGLALRTIPISLLVPLLYAATTGLICAAIWLRADPTPPARPLSLLTSIPFSVVVAVIALIIPAIGTAAWGGQWRNILWYGLVLIAIMIILRQALHTGLIDKAASIGHGGTLRCPHCGASVADVPFCSNCGMSMRSVDRRARKQATPQSTPEVNPGDAQ